MTNTPDEKSEFDSITELPFRAFCALILACDRIGIRYIQHGNRRGFAIETYWLGAKACDRIGIRYIQHGNRRGFAIETYWLGAKTTHAFLPVEAGG